MRCTFRAFIAHQSGATAIEYALIALMISIAIVAAVALVGTNLSSTFAAVAAGFP